MLFVPFALLFDIVTDCSFFYPSEAVNRLAVKFESVAELNVGDDVVLISCTVPTMIWPAPFVIVV